jgi:hypothetical protein
MTLTSWVSPNRKPMKEHNSPLRNSASLSQSNKTQMGQWKPTDIQNNPSKTLYRFSNSDHLK